MWPHLAESTSVMFSSCISVCVCVCQLKIARRLEVFTSRFGFTAAGLARLSTATNEIHVQVFFFQYDTRRLDTKYIQIKAHKSPKRKNDRYHECIIQLWRLKRFVSALLFVHLVFIYSFAFNRSTVITKYFYNKINVYVSEIFSAQRSAACDSRKELIRTLKSWKKSQKKNDCHHLVFLFSSSEFAWAFSCFVFLGSNNHVLLIEDSRTRER